ncbi:ABC transporter substrate-binding protein [Marinoscillum furvescens]|uniref:ABC-type nitrate/sulfonate/bicarbonate transport system substrate-binding protein n=1 Tax=Marinoscillum furvescens DSM 4134 TaxID=1122208 RepID=A0A3D9KXY0_MARFU|nr:ABC transporter substrate-binding protein [Marinoscillum furvescens]RED93664.1 ABC-type nitrate/sulfonate/bicarbonate transport system substrate-binding protein [Marinoscillum furvescens DSM 4134]
MTNLKIGGVPEYFNLPIHHAIASKQLVSKNIELKWQAVPEGTGALSQLLHTGELDLAVILLEGVTKSILEGNHIRILKNYVESPLKWGVHSTINNAEILPETMHSRRVAISRFGSGSHMMSYLLAEKYQWSPESLDFVVVNNLDGARAAFARQEVDLFLWEKYTTHPYVEAGEISRIDVLETPWPCFVLAANTATLQNHGDEVREVLQTINSHCHHLQTSANLAEQIMKAYDLSPQHAQRAAEEVRWSTDFGIDAQAIEKVVNTYQDLQIISTEEPHSAASVIEQMA